LDPLTQYYTRGLFKISPENRSSAKELPKAKSLSAISPANPPDIRAQKIKRQPSELPAISQLSLLANSLIWAAETKELGLFKALLKGGVKPPDSYGPINILCEGITPKDNLKVDSNLSVQDDNGWNPMHRAVFKDHADSSKAVKETESNISVRHDGGQTLMHRAAFNRYVNAIKALMETGTDVNVKDNDGCNPIHWAAFTGHVYAINFSCGVSALDEQNVMIDPLGIRQEGSDSNIWLCNSCHPSVMLGERLPESLANFRWVGLMPDELKDLTWIEELLITAIRLCNSSGLIRIKQVFRLCRKAPHLPSLLRRT